MLKFLEYAGMGLWLGFNLFHFGGTVYLAAKTRKSLWTLVRLAVVSVSVTGWVLVAPSVF